MTITEFFRKLIGKPLYDAAGDDADWQRRIEQDGFVTVVGLKNCPSHGGENDDA